MVVHDFQRLGFLKGPNNKVQLVKHRENLKINPPQWISSCPSNTFFPNGLILPPSIFNWLLPINTYK